MRPDAGGFVEVFGDPRAAGRRRPSHFIVGWDVSAKEEASERMRRWVGRTKDSRVP